MRQATRPAWRISWIFPPEALIAGSVLGCFLTTMPLSLATQRYGVEQVDYCKTAFGQKGSRIILIFYLINQLGWTGLILVMFGNG